jgi:hypothetical protein
MYRNQNEVKWTWVAIEATVRLKPLNTYDPIGIRNVLIIVLSKELCEVFSKALIEF